jgi:hypothetical protein
MWYKEMSIPDFTGEVQLSVKLLQEEGEDIRATT